MRRATLTIGATAAILAGACLATDVAPKPQPTKDGGAGSPAAETASELVLTADPGGGRIVNVIEPRDGSLRSQLQADGRGAVVHRAEGVAYLLNASSPSRGAQIARVDLRTGGSSTVEAARLDLGPQAVALQPADARIAGLESGAVVLLRTIQEKARSIVRAERYDGLTGALLSSAERTWPVRESPWSEITALPPDRYLVVHRGRADLGTLATWTVLDAQLREIAVLRSDVHGYDWLAWCDPRPLPLPRLGGFVATCPMENYREWQLVRIDRDFGVHRTELPPASQVGGLAGWRSDEAGVLTILTGEMKLLRVDLRSGQVVDKRNVTKPPTSWRWSPSVALAKISIEPRVQFSPDGRTVFIAAWDANAWYGAVAAIDVGTATMRSRALTGELVTGIHLSPDGRRLYAVAQQDWNASPELVTLDATSGAVMARVPLPRSPVMPTIVTVSSRQSE